MKYWVGVKWEFSRAGAYFFTEMILDGHEPATLVVENKSQLWHKNQQLPKKSQKEHSVENPKYQKLLNQFTQPHPIWFFMSGFKLIWTRFNYIKSNNIRGKKHIPENTWKTYIKTTPAFVHLVKYRATCGSLQSWKCPVLRQTVESSWHDLQCIE